MELDKEYNTKLVKWIINYLKPIAKEKKCNIWDLHIRPQEFALLVYLVSTELLDAKYARKLINEMVD